MITENWEILFERIDKFCKGLVTTLNKDCESGYFEKLQLTKEEMESIKEREFIEKHEQAKDLEKELNEKEEVEETNEPEETKEEVEDIEEIKESIKIPEDAEPIEKLKHVFINKPGNYTRKELVELTNEKDTTLFYNLKVLIKEWFLKENGKRGIAKLYTQNDI